MEITTTVKAITSAKGKTSGKEYWNIETDAGRMSCFEYKDVAPLMEYVGKSATIEYSLSKDGKYKNFVSFKAPTPEQKFAASLNENNVDKEKEKNRLIMRQVALKASVEYVDVIGDVNKVIEVAEVFNTWLNKS